ncbi:hypothetical protein JRO89_XS03G0209100 [Xanthoceras sorbifolium]|uniref:SHSP domain-containing protein n=1 Tax=Xanthoceras sorbifolium TaxID=99658 RepID=A0ABQ8IAX5_9ROSI|nr:hypothetical protein JRO89_XS03G0209100 [Xanthoceras sorbifolium]
MIFPFYRQNPIKISIPIHNSLTFFSKKASVFFVLYVISLYLFLCCGWFLFARAMKVYPVPTKKRNNITIQFYGVDATNSRNPQGFSAGSHKKLRRLPHIFTRVLELPFRSDADVVIEESPDCFKFVAETDGIGEVRAHMIQIHPGVTKIVVRPNGSVELSSLDELELDMWRFRLPETTRPELASAVYVDGELIVTVPKGREADGLAERGGGGSGGDTVGGGGGGNGQFRGVAVLDQKG